jgi:hypothetical protein
VSSTSMDHLDELRVATASSLPLNGLAPRTYARDHAHVRGPLQSTRPHCGLLVDRLSSSRIPASRARRMTATPAPSGSASLSESLNRVQR